METSQIQTPKISVCVRPWSIGLLTSHSFLILSVALL